MNRTATYVRNRLSLRSPQEESLDILADLAEDLPLEKGREILICFQLTLSVNPADYTLTVDCSEPTDEGPNQGAFQDVIEGLGPISVHFDLQDMWPFYGMAQLPLKVSFETIRVNTGRHASPPDQEDGQETGQGSTKSGETAGNHHASE